MRSFLTTFQLQMLAQALVISALDYCNALYYGFDAKLIQQLQHIQNSACRVIFGLKCRESVTKYLQKLHWLKIEDRAIFKILLLTYKSLNGTAPTYLSNLITYNHLSGSRTPSLQPNMTSSKHGHRSFKSSSPELWNTIPAHLKQLTDINLFKKQLKTFLFVRTYIA